MFSDLVIPIVEIFILFITLLHEQAVVWKTLWSAGQLQVMPYNLDLSSCLFSLDPGLQCFSYACLKILEENHFPSVDVMPCYLFTLYSERKLPNNKRILLLQLI